jgi:Na+-driven multidrug efflux pump
MPSNSSLTHQDLTTGSIYQHLIRLAIPASMGMFFNTLYNLTDNWFAGKISDDALVGLSIASIVFTFLSVYSRACKTAHR